MVAIAGDDAVLVTVERRLEPDRDRLLADIQVTETADEAEAVKLPGLFLETADEQHFAVEGLHLLARGGEPLWHRRAFTRGRGGGCEGVGDGFARSFDGQGGLPLRRVDDRCYKRPAIGLATQHGPPAATNSARPRWRKISGDATAG